MTSDPPLPKPVIEAIAHHDDGWDRQDAAPKLHEGKPRDFRRVPPEVARPIRRRCVEKGREIGPYVAWLISMHGCNLPMKKTPGALDFLDQQEQLRHRLDQRHDFPPPARRERDFNWLQFSDLLSLFLLQPEPWDQTVQWNRPHPGSVSARITGEGSCQLRTGGELTPGTHEFSYTYRRIEDHVYEHEEDLRAAYAEAKRREGGIRLRVS